MQKMNVNPTVTSVAGSSTKKKSLVWKNIKRSKYFYMMLLPTLVWYLIFCYQPMYGAQIAFKDFKPGLGILESPWIGFEYFKQFFDSPFFFRLLRNTLGISVFDLIVGFPAPIILALLINEVSSIKLKRSVQTIVYLPHFISTVVVSGLVLSILAPRTGVVNQIIAALGGQQIHFMAEKQYFKTIYVLSGIWQGAGWGSIIYIAAILGIDPSLYEAATVDGANKLKRMMYITLPGIAPTIITMLILRMGSLFSVGYEKVMLLYNASIYETADVISTFVYRRGIQGGEFSFSTAVGLFNSVLNFIVLITFNFISKRTSQVSIF